MKNGTAGHPSRGGGGRPALLATALLVVAASLHAPAHGYGGDRKVVFECPCSAEFTPDGDSGEGAVTLRFGLRNHRDARSASLIVVIPPWTTNSDGTQVRSNLALDAIPLQSPTWEHGIAATRTIQGLTQSARVQQPGPNETLEFQLWEADGDWSSRDATGRLQDFASRHERLTLWPVPDDQAGSTTRYVDILTDSDGDGVGDVNEGLAGTDPDNPAAAPGSSEVDVLWLYQASLAAPDTVPEYHHAAVVANAMFVDSGTNLRLRTVGFAAVDNSDMTEWGTVEEEHLGVLLDQHGADLHNFWYDRGDGIRDYCPTGAIGCAGLGDFSGRGVWSPALSFTSRAWPDLIAHELGHVLGLAHSARQGESYGSFRWSRGHYIGDWEPHNTNGTIMSYGKFHSPVFSSPALDQCQPWGACGLPATHLRGADAARSLDLIRFQAAKVRGPKPDTDGDGFVDAADAFPNDASDWADLDGDGTGDNADPDMDGDGRANADDAFAHDPDEWADLDGDGVGDNADPDRDGDGVENGDDLFPDDALDHADSDGDGVGDNAQALHPFRDAKLRAAVEQALGKAAGAPISATDMAGLAALEAFSTGISDLTGLELATGLTKLNLDSLRGGYRGTNEGGVVDLTPLADLQALETLSLAMSPSLTDLSPLAGLRNLKSLGLTASSIRPPSGVRDLKALESLPLTELVINRASVSDVSPLSGLSQLAHLDLNSNQVTDLSGLSGLSQLQHLALFGNGVSDIAPLAGLSNLRTLRLGLNLVTDISPLSGLSLLGTLSLADNKIRDVTGLGRLTGLSSLSLRNNLVADIAPLSSLLQLDYLNLNHNSISDVSPLSSLLQLGSLYVAHNAIADLSPLTALTGLRSLNVGGHPMSFSDFLEDFRPGPQFRYLDLSYAKVDDLAPLADFMERSGARKWTLYLSYNPYRNLGPLVRPAIWERGSRITLVGVSLDRDGADADIAQLEAWGVTVSGYRPEADNAPRAVNFPDRRLGDFMQEQAAAWGSGLMDQPVTTASAARIPEILAFGQGIADLTGLEAATGLRRLHLGGNAVADLSPILGLEALDYVDLDGNPLSEAALNVQVPALLADRVDVQLDRVSWRLPAGGPDATFATQGYFAARLGVPATSGIAFSASSGNAFLSPSVAADGTLRLAPRRIAGPAEVVVEARAGGELAKLAFTVVARKDVPLFLGVADGGRRESFLRVMNHAGRAGDVRIEATDALGHRPEAVLLSLEAGQAVQLTSRELEEGNAAKGLPKGIGEGEGDWRLALSGALNAEALSSFRAGDGLVTAVNAATRRVDGGPLSIGFLNPGSNHRQQSRLRLVNPGVEAATVRITGTDDAGAPGAGAVSVDVPAGHALTFTAAELESGHAPGLSGALGDGRGKWRLRIESDGAAAAMSLVEAPAGHLANLSAPAEAARPDGARTVPFLPSASDARGRQGFMRVVNRSGASGAVRIRAFDGSDFAYGPVTLSLGPHQARQFSSRDLESGNAARGLSGSTGAGRGDWRLELDGDLDFEASAYVRYQRADDGFLTSLQSFAPELDAGLTHRIAFFNPGSNPRQVSRLLLVNRGAADAQAAVAGIDDAGRSHGGPVRVRVPAGGSVALGAKALEEGASGFEGSLGDGRGKWRLCVTSDAPILALSLLETPTGHLTNMSTLPDLFDCADAD